MRKILNKKEELYKKEIGEIDTFGKETYKLTSLIKEQPKLLGKRKMPEEFKAPPAVRRWRGSGPSSYLTSMFATPVISIEQFGIKKTEFAEGVTIQTMMEQV